MISFARRASPMLTLYIFSELYVTFWTELLCHFAVVSHVESVGICKSSRVSWISNSGLPVRWKEKKSAWRMHVFNRRPLIRPRDPTTRKSYPIFHLFLMSGVSFKSQVPMANRNVFCCALFAAQICSQLKYSCNLAGVLSSTLFNENVNFYPLFLLTILLLCFALDRIFRLSISFRKRERTNNFPRSNIQFWPLQTSDGLKIRLVRGALIHHRVLFSPSLRYMEDDFSLKVWHCLFGMQTRTESQSFEDGWNGLGSHGLYLMVNFIKWVNLHPSIFDQK